MMWYSETIIVQIDKTKREPFKLHDLKINDFKSRQRYGYQGLEKVLHIYQSTIKMMTLLKTILPILLVIQTLYLFQRW